MRKCDVIGRAWRTSLFAAEKAHTPDAAPCQNPRSRCTRARSHSCCTLRTAAGREASRLRDGCQEASSSAPPAASAAGGPAATGRRCSCAAGVGRRCLEAPPPPQSSESGQTLLPPACECFTSYQDGTHARHTRSCCSRATCWRVSGSLTASAQQRMQPPPPPSQQQWGLPPGSSAGFPAAAQPGQIQWGADGSHAEAWDQQPWSSNHSPGGSSGSRPIPCPPASTSGAADMMLLGSCSTAPAAAAAAGAAGGGDVLPSSSSLLLCVDSTMADMCQDPDSMSWRPGEAPGGGAAVQAAGCVHGPPVVAFKMPTSPSPLGPPPPNTQVLCFKALGG
jgi:hypothetical protein